MNRKILALAIPNIISNITVPLVGIVDMAIVGHLGVDSLIGAMAIGVAIFNFIYWNFAFLRMGTSGLVAQAYGARDFREVGSVFVRSVSVALAVALLLLIARYGVGHLAFRMMDGTPETMREAAEFSMCGCGPRPLRCRSSRSRVGLSACRIRVSRCTFRSSSTC